MMHRLTGEIRYLERSLASLRFIETHPRYPEDGVPYWDFDAPGLPAAPREAYSVEPGTSGGFLLTRSTGFLPMVREIDVPLNCTDYYYLEALQRRRRILAGLPPVEDLPDPRGGPDPRAGRFAAGSAGAVAGGKVH